MLEVRGLRFRREGRMVLEIPAFAVAEGQVVAIVGPNGAGKSTLLQAVGLLNRAQFDSYRFDGQQANLPRGGLVLRRKMAMVLQEPLLLDTTALENAASGLRLRGVERRVALERGAQWLERCGVGNLAGRLAHRLSGGEARRVSLARALALAPRLLLLDEPFSALDLLTRGDLVQDFRRLLRETSTAALLVTHDVTEMAELADRVAVLEGGRLAQEGTPAEVLANPGTSLVRKMSEVASRTAAALRDLATVSGAGEFPIGGGERS